MSKPVTPGDPAPYFTARTANAPQFSFDVCGGRWLVVGFVGPDAVARAFDRRVFDDRHASLFAVRAADDVAQSIPGLRVFIDPEAEIAAAFGRSEGWVVVDPEMRVHAILPADADVARLVSRLPPAGHHTGLEIQAPILVLPRVFEPAVCEHLVQLYEAQGGQESGFMREVDGKTTAVQDARHKVRRDAVIDDPKLRGALQARILDRVVPMIAKAHQFHATRMERYIVSCYDAADGGHFNMHRDNTTSGTAHRRFAVSINLNDGFEGGAVSFPEYGPRGYKAPAGGAVVFSCSLLHMVSKVTEGRRYAFLPFLYDDAAAEVRAANNVNLAEGVASYRGG